VLAGWVLAGGCAPTVFDRPFPIAAIELPRDDAGHPAPIEWWYYVGHLDTEDGRRLGFELTFFKAYVPPALRLGEVLPLSWLIEKGHVAHAAISDLTAGSFVMEQRSDLGLLAGHASLDALDVAVGDWRTVHADDGVSHAISFAVAGRWLDLVLTPVKPATLHGEPPGIQTMGPAGVSHYVSYTRMEAQGTLREDCAWRGCAEVAVTGSAWHDHQWGDFRVDAVAGWDWFALQFGDGADLMLYLIREPDGGYGAAAGSYVTARGRSVPLSAHEFAVLPTGATWASPATGAVYPAGWRVLVPAFGVDVTVAPLLADQEFDGRPTTGIVYWEGAVGVAGSHPGLGYVELTNYDRHPIGRGGRVPGHDPSGFGGPP
jgi:predicted secreted hydrolase